MTKRIGKEKARSFERAFLLLRDAAKREQHREVASGLKVLGSSLAAALVLHDFERDLLTFVQGLHAGTLHGRDVNEHILAAVIRLNETKAFLGVEPLHGSSAHRSFSSQR
jgi:hypothetical protein